MATLDDMVKLRPQHVLVYGPPKSGKTELIGTLASEFKLIYFDLESGIDTLLKLPSSSRKNITPVIVRDTVEAPRAVATIDKIVRGGHFDICTNHGTINCAECKRTGAAFESIDIPTTVTEESLKIIIVIDSASQLTISANSAVNILSNRVTTVDFIPERAKNWGDEWGAQGKFLDRIFSNVQNAPFHIVCTAHEIQSEREDGGKRIVPSIGTAPYAMNCSKFFGHVVYLDKINMKHKAFSSTAFSNTILSGSRLGIELEGMKTPNLIPIFKGEVPTQQETKKESAATTLGALGALSGLSGLKL